MKIKTVGEILRSHRQQQSLSLEEFSKMTRIRLENLEALENDQFDKLPSAVFVKGYIKTYSTIFGFDYQPVLALLRRDFKESAVGKLVPREFIKPMLKKRRTWAPITVVFLGLAIVFLTLVGYVSIQWYNIQKPPTLEISSPQENEFVSSHIEVKGQTVNDAIVAVNTQPVAIQPDGSFKTEVYLPREGIHILTIEAVDRRGKKSVVQRPVRVQF
jgi:cytoskeletal protein RodZ